MGLFGGSTALEYGIQHNGNVTWYGSKAIRDGKLKAMKRASGTKSGTFRAVQRSVKVKPKAAARADDKCSGGKCKRNNFCTKHGKAAGRNMSKVSQVNLYDAQGRNKNGIRYDANGKRIWD